MVPHEPIRSASLSVHKRIMLRNTILLVAVISVSVIVFHWRNTPSFEQTIIELHTEATYQTMNGWEASAYIGQTDQFSIFKNWQEQVLDQAVDLGINRVRVPIFSGMENSTDWFQLLLDGAIPYSTYRSHYYEIVNDNTDANSVNLSGFKWSLLDKYIDEVVIPLKRRLANTGESLWIHCHYQTNDQQANSQFHRDNPAEYAEFVLAVYQHLQGKYGVVPDSWSIVNEPDNVGVRWSGNSGTVLGTMAKAAGDILVANGFTPAFVLPGTEHASLAASYFDNAMAVLGTKPYVVGLDYHRYAETVTDSMLLAVGDRARSNGITSGMTEHIGADYTELHKDLTLGRCSFWQQFTLASPWQGDDGGKYFPIDASNPASPIVSIGTRTKFLRQYFKFIRMGAVRVGASTTNSNLDPVAFRNTDANYVVVVKATRNGSFSIEGLPSGAYGIKYTTLNQYDIDAPDVTISSTQALDAMIPDAGVVTVYAKQSQPLPDQRAIIDQCTLNRSSSGSVSLTVVGRNIRAGATVTVGGITPKKIKFRDEVSPGQGIFTRLLLKKKLCGGLPGDIVITNPGAPPSAPLRCNSSCE